MQYYLQGYNIRLLYDEFVPDYASARYSYQIPAGVSTVLVMDFGRSPQLQLPPAYAGGEMQLSGSNSQRVNLWRFEVKQGDTIEYGYDYFGIR